jgi:NADH:ubiquinone oxidoreductase subunit B-like Fe-S oxidoreductase
MNKRENTLGPRQTSWHSHGNGIEMHTLNKANFLNRVKGWSRSQLLSSFVIGGNCCARELYRLSGPNPQASGVRENFTEADPIESSDVLIVSGVITKGLKPYILEAYERMLKPRYVMAIGACTATGAVFETEALDSIVPVDVFVSGCPPTLEALIHGLELLRDRVRKGVPRSESYAELEKTLGASVES